MQRIALSVEYDGREYHGWQRQKHCLGVQEVLERALEKIAQQQIEVICSGRTDAGVHGLGQVVHFDTAVTRPLSAWVGGVNRHLPANVSVHWAQVVDPLFHARYTAIARSYRYVIRNSQIPSALMQGRMALIFNELDAGMMNRAAQALVGEHDFSAFRAVGCQAQHARRSLESISVRRCNEMVYVDITANAFLYNMVRIIVGTLIRVGHGKASETWVAELLAARSREHLGVTAPPDGLYFLGPHYESKWSIPCTALPAWLDFK